jgi:VWFA-related protein
MNRFGLFPVFACMLAASPLLAQVSSPEPVSPAATLRVNTRAVLLDVLVTDHSGKPVTGLKQDAFSVAEQGKPQAVSYFEEHSAAQKVEGVEMPTLPLDVFTNFSPFPLPAAVNVLLLDSLNTQIGNQSFVHKQALKFLQGAKPGSRMAIFTMALGLHFVQGFTDDPALLVAGLADKKNNEVQESVMIKGQEETNAQAVLFGMMSEVEGNGGTAADPAMLTDLQKFIQENDDSQTTDRALLTLANLQRLATFLSSFPGRKNLIWFSESIPFLTSNILDPHIEQEYFKTMNMLAAARVAVYPVSATGVASHALYEAYNNPSAYLSTPMQVVGGGGIGATSVMSENSQRDSLQESMKRFAYDTGGKAFVNTNGLAEVIGDIASTGSDFYTLSYTPTNQKMDGGERKMEVKVSGGKYNLSYRRSYYAIDQDLPGSAQELRNQAVRNLATKNPGAVDPLLPFMDLGMPPTQQILYKVLIQPIPAAQDAAAGTAEKAALSHYSIDFAINRDDLRLRPEADGTHQGVLNEALIVYDRYGAVVSRKDHVIALNIKPGVYTVFQQTGVQLHDSIEVPKGQYWLRAGIYDQASHKVGTMEVPLSQVKPLQVAAK